MACLTTWLSRELSYLVQLCVCAGATHTEEIMQLCDNILKITKFCIFTFCTMCLHMTLLHHELSVVCCRHWQHHWRRLWIVLLVTSLIIETLNLAHICTYSKTWHLKLPILPQKSGLTWQVASRDTYKSYLGTNLNCLQLISFNDTHHLKFFLFWDILVTK